MLQNFKCYQLAKAVYLKTQKIKLKGPIKDQLERASLSVVLNLSEGSGKLSLKDKRRFYVIAMGSIREVEAILDLLGEHKEEAELLDHLAASTWKLIQKTGQPASASRL